MSNLRIRNVLSAVGWESLLVPLGTALLTIGVTHLQQRADDVTELVDELDERVILRRAQLAGTKPLVDEPAQLVDEPAASRRPGKLAIVALVLAAGVAAVKISAGVRGFLGDLLDQLDDDNTYAEDDESLFDGVEGARPGPLVDEPVPALIEE